MEPAEAPLKTNYVIHTQVSSVIEHKKPVYVSGVGDNCVFTDVSQGWFVYLAGSHEALHLGMDKPELEKGDKVKITLEKVNG